MTIDETSQADASVSTETVTNPTPPNAREMVLDLLTTHDAHELPLKALVRAGNLFGYTDQTVRVALSRLKADGVIASPARGVHALAAAGALVREVEGWRRREGRLVAWSGAWIGVADAAIDRTDRPQLRRHDRALRLRGFRQLTQGVWIRPDNLAGGTTALRDDLAQLGLAPLATVFRLDDLAPEDERRARALWDAASMDRTEADLDRLLVLGNAAQDAVEAGEAAPEPVAADSLAIGRTVIRNLVRDPLLPDELRPGETRRRLTEGMIAYQLRAKALWIRLLDRWAAGG